MPTSLSATILRQEVLVIPSTLFNLHYGELKNKILKNLLNIYIIIFVYYEIKVRIVLKGGGEPFNRCTHCLCMYLKTDGSVRGL